MTAEEWQVLENDPRVTIASDGSWLPNTPKEDA